MLLRSFFPGKWKHNRWKNMKLYSTYNQTLKTHLTDIISTNIAITEHSRKGQLHVARNLFDQMPQRTVVSWNTMISGYSKWGKFNESLSLASTMHRSNVKLNETTISTVLSVCAQLQSLIAGKQIQGLVLKSGYESFELVGSSLLYFYANCFKIEEAKQVFEDLREENGLLWSVMLVGYVQCNLMSDALDLFMKMPRRDVIVWTKLISGYVKSEDGCDKALELFWWMIENAEVMPDEFTFDAVVRACGRLGVLCEGRLVHGMLIKCGYEFDHLIGGALIEFYCSCEHINEAKRVYDRVANPGLDASNSLISGLILMRRIEDAELVFNRLTETNSVSYNLMIKGYAVEGRVEDSKRLFEKMPHRTIISSNTMISVYSRNGEIHKALKLFEETKGERNPVTWNSMMSGYIQNDRHEEALELYVTMCRLAIDRSRSTFSVLFHACSCLGSLQQGQLLHAHLIKTPFESNVYVGTSLIDMYSKCGNITEAQASFSCISSPNVAAWTSLINGYAHHGLGSEAIMLFEHMIEQGVLPNAATFVGILSACCHTGLVNEGMKIFHSMEKCYGVTPTIEHYTCVVDLLGRSGHLREAEEFIKEMPIQADEVVWGALLSACWFSMNMEEGKRVAEKIFGLDPKPVSAYVILSNIYAILGKWGEKMQMRKTLQGLEVKKNPGCSWIELSSKVYVFSVEDRKYPDCNVMYATLEHLTANLNSIVQFDEDSISV
ncbi:hypothetical protein ACOSP7_027631 [Xanthoceras sorbifolium]|uniref:Pentatricopeptide repeat-containing protein n=1 Tax=Xanthoceras sorbifolium TaxID=99658 RepID=A0ABQ8HGJ4_9ROSI|nr:hypothetical protein JRO89_XS11G0213800 [Xanthoceras sorbifolium]